MASLRNKFSNILVAAGIVSLGAGAALGIVAITILSAVGVFAAITALQALFLWVVWNWTAPLFNFIPAEYQALGFMTVWGVVAVVRIIGRIVFGTMKKSGK